MRVASETDASGAAVRQMVVVRKLLALPEHGHAFERIERDGVWLKLVETAAVTGWEKSVTLSSGEDDELAVIVRFEILDRKSTRLNSSHGYISYAVFCLKKKKNLPLLYAMWRYWLIWF